MTDLPPLRIGVTGSRLFGALPVIRSALAAAWDVGQPGQVRTLVHGQCDPRHPETGRMIPWDAAKRLSWEFQGRLLGADWLAEWCALSINGVMPWEVERHPADWQAPCRPECRPGHRRRKGRGPEYCPAAGNYRNQEGIIGPGLGVLLALYKQGAANTGTSDCVRRAKAAGVPVRPFTA